VKELQLLDPSLLHRLLGSLSLPICTEEAFLRLLLDQLIAFREQTAHILPSPNCPWIPWKFVVPEPTPLVRRSKRKSTASPLHILPSLSIPVAAGFTSFEGFDPFPVAGNGSPFSETSIGISRGKGAVPLSFLY
jgi:hypothetical protein